MYKVCILLAAFNGEKYISEQLDSILMQENIALDVFISLDESNDKTKSIIDFYTRKYKNIYLLPYGVSFGSAIKNFINLIENVNFNDYDFISFSDQDDIWFNDKLETAINQIQFNNVDGYSGNVTAFWENGKTKLVHKSSKQVSYDYFFESSGPGCTFVLTKTLALSIQSYLSHNKHKVSLLWMHDWFIYCYARSNNYSWFIDVNPKMLYRQHKSNTVGANSGFRAIKRRISAVTNGDAVKKVIDQADFLGINSFPIKLIKTNNFYKLAIISAQCRRKKSDKILFFIAMLILFIKNVF